MIGSYPYLSGYLVMRVCHKTTSSLIPDPYNDYYRWGFHHIQFVINPQCMHNGVYNSRSSSVFYYLLHDR